MNILEQLNLVITSVEIEAMTVEEKSKVLVPV